MTVSKPTPLGIPGYDVNRGCKLSYTGEDVTAQNFLAVLKGDNKTTGAHTCIDRTCIAPDRIVSTWNTSEVATCWDALDVVVRRGARWSTELAGSYFPDGIIVECYFVSMSNGFPS